jgi:hypothetical protein
MGEETGDGTQNEATREIDGGSSEGGCFPPERYPVARADRLERLLAWRNREATAAIAAGAPAFLGKPDAWYERPHWFCTNGHVSARCLTCEDGDDLCLACMTPVVMGPPLTEAQSAVSGWDAHPA